MMVFLKRVVFSFALLALPVSAMANSLYIKHKHTGEEERITFKSGGSYSQAGLKKLNWMLRDWRKDEPTEMDPALFDIMHEIYRQTGSSEAIHVVSAYRSSGTNAMLRRRSRGVARNSQHVQGRAMDFYIPGVSTAQIREIALKLEMGGVGFYPRAGTAFIHVDSGSVRHWPKMSRDQLARVFPDGKTVHIPRDGKPLNGFDLALANLQKRGGSFSRTLAYSNAGENEEKGDGGRLMAALFGRKPVEPPQIKTFIPAKPAPVIEPEKDEAEAEKSAKPLAKPTVIAAKPAALERPIVSAEKPPIPEKIPFKILPPPKFLIASAPLPPAAPREREMMRANVKMMANVPKPLQNQPPDPSKIVATAPLTLVAPVPSNDPRIQVKAKTVEPVKAIEPVKMAEVPLPQMRKDNILSVGDKIVPQSFAAPLITPSANSFSGSSVVRVPSMSLR